jgi:hypothetical protein
LRFSYKWLQSCNYTLSTDIPNLIYPMTHCFGNFANREPIALLRRGLCVQWKNAVLFGYLRDLLLGKLKTQLQTCKARRLDSQVTPKWQHYTAPRITSPYISFWPTVIHTPHSAHSVLPLYLIHSNRPFSIWSRLWFMQSAVPGYSVRRRVN